MLLMLVSCDESCPTWLHPSGDGECVCDPFETVVVCKNGCKNETHVSVLDFYCLTSNGDGRNTSMAVPRGGSEGSDEPPPQQEKVRFYTRSSLG